MAEGAIQRFGCRGEAAFGDPLQKIWPFDPDLPLRFIRCGSIESRYNKERTGRRPRVSYNKSSAAVVLNTYLPFPFASSGLVRGMMNAMNDPSAKVGQQTPLREHGMQSRGGARRIEGNRGTPITFTFDGQLIEAFEGETVAAALLACGVQAMRKTSRKGEPRGLFCNMGICFDCLIEVNGNANQRGCQFPVTNGLEIKSQPIDPLEHCE